MIVVVGGETGIWESLIAPIHWETPLFVFKVVNILLLLTTTWKANVLE